MLCQKDSWVRIQLNSIVNCQNHVHPTDRPTSTDQFNRHAVTIWIFGLHSEHLICRWMSLIILLPATLKFVVLRFASSKCDHSPQRQRYRRPLVSSTAQHVNRRCLIKRSNGIARIATQAACSNRSTGKSYIQSEAINRIWLEWNRHCVDSMDIDSLFCLSSRAPSHIQSNNRSVPNWWREDDEKE